MNVDKGYEQKFLAVKKTGILFSLKPLGFQMRKMINLMLLLIQQ